ncbi:hypothetical protein AVEN_13493-1 [Araneus ventricosus]|uniref:Uncharacterized protein n=1 Tax=Araneus ventricosus TaxID=182803 RepID=A0A4Y2MLB4_ARAVE|nr:hypothetical protein AVEN_13493-1 [Araneus ventricosus]
MDGIKAPQRYLHTLIPEQTGNRCILGPYCKDGARHLFKIIASTRYLHTELKAQVDPVIQRNSYFSHRENLLIAMLTDSEPHVRELEVHLILKARGIQENGFCLFQLPTVKFNASSYTDRIDWQKNVADPPILKSIHDKEIRLFAVQHELS